MLESCQVSLPLVFDFGQNNTLESRSARHLFQGPTLGLQTSCDWIRGLPGHIYTWWPHWPAGRLVAADSEEFCRIAFTEAALTAD